MNESLFSKIVVAVVGGVLTTVLGYIAIEMIKPNFSNESHQRKQEIESGNRSSYTAPLKSGNNTVVKSPEISPLPKHQSNFSEPIKAKKEDYNSYINPLNRANVSVVILDPTGKLSITMASEIAEVYRKAGITATSGLIRSTFISKPEFQELWEGNSEIIQKLNLGAYTDYLAIGEINFTNRTGKLVDGTVICTASITMSIISTRSKSLKNSFAISNATGNGATESQAKEDALQKLLDRYYNEHSSL